MKSRLEFPNLKNDEVFPSHRAEGLEGKPGAVPGELSFPKLQFLR